MKTCYICSPYRAKSEAEVGKTLLLLCDSLIIGNRHGISQGMQAEIELSIKKDIPAICITDDTTAAELKDLVERVGA